MVGSFKIYLVRVVDGVVDEPKLSWLHDERVRATWSHLFAFLAHSERRTNVYLAQMFFAHGLLCGCCCWWCWWYWLITVAAVVVIVAVSLHI